MQNPTPIHRCVFGCVLGLLFCCGQQVQAQVADGYLKTWMADRVRQLEHDLSPRQIDAVGWAPSIQRALNLAQEHQRPVFLFTLDGHMDTGRC